jgi:hypothetical protein
VSMPSAEPATTDSARLTRAGAQERERVEWKPALANGLVNLPMGGLVALMEFYGTRTVRMYDQRSTMVNLVMLATCIGVPLGISVYSRWRGRLVARSPEVIRRVAAPPRTNDPEMDTTVTLWKEVVDVQMHFNDMLMRTRNYALTLLLAILAGSGVALEKSEVIDLAHGVGQISLASVLLLLGVLGLLAFYALDRFYYHSLLVGAVSKGVEIEGWLFPTMPAIDLAGVITTHSRLTWGPFKIYARHKLTIFYLSLAVLLTGMASLVKNVGVGKQKDTVGSVLCAAVRGSDSAVVWVGQNCTIQTVVTPAERQVPLSAKGSKPK